MAGLSSARELLEGASAVIDAWMLQAGEKSVRTLQGALEVGGRALISSGVGDEAAAERYRRSLMRLQQELPAIESRLQEERRKLVEERGVTDRAARWVQESRELM